MPVHKDLNHHFFKNWTPEMAYVLGFFSADGTMIKNNRGAHFIEFHITDRIILVRIRAAMKSNHKISVRIRKRRAHRIGYRLQVGSKEMFLDLSRLGFTPNKSKTIRFPDIPDHLLGHFIRGYFDGDGCVSFKRYVVKGRKNPKWVFSTRFTSGCRTFLELLHNALKSRGVVGGFILEKTGKSGYELVLSHKDSLALSDLMYNNVASRLFLPRKFEIYKKAIRVLFDKKLVRP